MHLFFLFAEFSKQTYSINPCTNPTEDTYIAAIDNDDEAIGMDLVTTAGRKFKRIRGCCSSLSSILHVTNLKWVMEVMKLSIGTTVPHPSQYSTINSTNDIKLLESLYPPEILATKLQNRYENFEHFNLNSKVFYSLEI